MRRRDPMRSPPSHFTSDRPPASLRTSAADRRTPRPRAAAVSIWPSSARPMRRLDAARAFAFVRAAEHAGHR